jgi:leucine dehydrogenase
MGVFEEIRGPGHERVVFGQDIDTGLRSIIAIYSTALGPALGGARLYPYQSDEAALNDVLRLSEAMAFKASAAGLSLGGGKAVLIGDRSVTSDEYWRAFGRFVDSLGGAYITAEDVGTTSADMGIIGEETIHVVGRDQADHGSGDPSPATARGVLRSMQATAHHLWGSDELHGVVIAVQGVGKVGSALVELLVAEGAEVVVADINEEASARLVERFGVKSVAPDEILSTRCEIIAPCSLGAILSPQTIPILQCRAVVGSANNQLSHPSDADLLANREILYVPDFIANAAGLIHVADELEGFNAARATKRIDHLFDAVTRILEQAQADGITPNAAAVNIAEERIRREQYSPTFRFA